MNYELRCCKSFLFLLFRAFKPDFLWLIPFVLVFLTVFVVSKDLANGVVSGKYFWFYASMGTLNITTFIYALSRKSCFRFTLLDFLVTLFAGNILFSSLVINDASQNTTKLVLLALLLVLYFCLRLVVAGKVYQGITGQARNNMVIFICVFIILTGLVEAVWGLMQLYGFALSQHPLFKLTGSFYNPGPFAGYLAMVFPLALQYWMKQFETYIENGQRASIHMLFVKKHQRSSFPNVLKNNLISKAIELGGGSWSVYGLGDGFDNEIKEQAGSSRIKLLGYNYDELYALAEAVKDSLLQYRRIKEVIIDSEFSWYKNDYSEFVFSLNKERLAQKGITPVDMFNSLTPLFEKNSYVADWIYQNRIDPIVLSARQSKEFDIWNLVNYPGKIGDKKYKLTEAANIEKWQAPQSIAKENQQYRLCIQYEYIGAYQQAWKVNERTIELFNRTAPLGYKAEQDNARYWWNEGKSGQYGLLFIIIVIIYFTTSILFNSLKQPLVIIFIIPISFIGLFLTFYFFNLNFDQGGFAAFILLTGITVNANIYILNEYNNIKKNHPNMEPVKIYLKAWNAKIRPIFLTIISTTLGFIPFIIGYRESFWFPLAAGTIGGLIISLLGIFIFRPVFMGIKNG